MSALFLLGSLFILVRVTPTKGNMKECSKCHHTKPLEYFYKDSHKKDGHWTECKQCAEKREKKYRFFHTDEIRKKKQLSRKRNPIRDKDNDYRRKYGISFEGVKQMYVNQNGQCALCSYRFNKRKDIHVDHNHTTGKVRGLLCMKCNIQIGYIEKAEPVLGKITEYLQASA